MKEEGGGTRHTPASLGWVAGWWWAGEACNSSTHCLLVVAMRQQPATLCSLDVLHATVCPCAALATHPCLCVAAGAPGKVPSLQSLIAGISIPTLIGPGILVYDPWP